MRVFRASSKDSRTFDPLYSRGSVSSQLGWRFNDPKTELLYTAEVESLAVLEVAVRPGWEHIIQITIATIELPDDSVVDLSDLGILLPSNWNSRPAASDSRRIGRQFLEAISKMPESARPLGVRVPSVLSGTDHNVLLDPSRKSLLKAEKTNLIPFASYRATAT